MKLDNADLIYKVSVFSDNKTFVNLMLIKPFYEFINDNGSLANQEYVARQNKILQKLAKEILHNCVIAGKLISAHHASFWVYPAPSKVKKIMNKIEQYLPKVVEFKDVLPKEQQKLIWLFESITSETNSNEIKKISNNYIKALKSGVYKNSIFCAIL